MRGKPKSRRRRYYGFVDAAIPSDPEHSRSREVLLLDCVDAEAFDEGHGSLDVEENLALIRVMSTRRRLADDFNLAPPQEGDWLELTIADERGSPRAWVMPASSGYESEKGSNLRSIAKLPEPGGASAGAIVAARLAKECDLGDAKKFGTGAADFRAEFHATLSGNLEIRAVDVGHASCNLFLIDGKPAGYFDVGAPLYRNQTSFHGRLCHKPPSGGFVILSHWDFDHFDLGRRKPELQQLDWLAPDQPVGPNTLKFQKKLGARLSFFPGPIVYSSVAFRPGTATDPKDRNGTGYSMRIEIQGDVIVLTGDCAYDRVSPDNLDGATAITIPHHGGASSASPPPPFGKATAVASYGKPNCYRHPSEAYLDQHATAGWNVLRTADYTPQRSVRGPRRLYP